MPRRAIPASPKHAECVPLDVADHAAVVAFCREKAIDLVVVGPEAPLVAGLVDDLRAAGIRVFGPSQGGGAARRLEGLHQGSLRPRRHPDRRLSAASPMPRRRRPMSRSTGAPIVVKADGLAAGKGVTVAMTVDEALAAVDACFDGAFGGAGAEVVIEEFLEGEEASFFCLCDGKTVLPFGTAQDHKRVGDGDTGPEHRRHGRLFAGAGHDARDDRAHHARDRRADHARHGRAGRAVLRRALRRADDHRRRARS